MAIFDIFKKRTKKEEKKKTIKKETVAKPKTEETPVSAAPIKKEVDLSESYQIIKSPQITEKASELAEKNQYVFKIFPQANKIQIKKAIEKIYGVNVEKVRIINIPSKERQLGRISGIKPGYKKAIVKIRKGQKIEILPR